MTTSTAPVPIKTQRVGSALLIIDGDKILLGKRAKNPGFGNWVLPGGKVEWGETHIQAAIRGGREELGLDVEPIRLAGKGVYYMTNGDVQRVIVYNIARAVGGTLTPSSDISEARYFIREELKNLGVGGSSAEVLKDEGWL
jgi:8-oxo-dGTP diphosphatase